MKKSIALILAAVLLCSVMAGCGNTAATSTATAAPAAATEAAATEAPAAATEAAATTAPAATTEEARELKLGLIGSSTTTNYIAGEKLAAAVEEISGGLLTINVIGNSQLGDQAQHCSQLSAGTLDLFLTGLDTGAQFKGGEDFSIFDAPFVFNDVDHFQRFLDSDAFQTMVQSIRDKANVECLGPVVNNLPRGLQANKAIYSVDDVVGLKIRVPETQAMVAVWQGLGASPVIISGSELYTALESGLADAQDNDPVGSFNGGLFDALDYYMETQYIYQALAVFASTQTMNTLSDTQKEWLKEGMKKVYDEYSAELWGQIDTVKEKLAAAGKTYITGDEMDLQSFRDKATPIVEGMCGKFFSQEVYDAVKALQ